MSRVIDSAQMGLEIMGLIALAFAVAVLVCAWQDRGHGRDD